jgi:hypothetical protein
VPDGPAVSFPVTTGRPLELLKRRMAPERFTSSRHGPVATFPRRAVSAAVTVRDHVPTLAAGAASARDAAGTGTMSIVSAASVRVSQLVDFTARGYYEVQGAAIELHGAATSQGGAGAILAFMCRNIRTLHNFEPPATEEEIEASALQYVRKLSGATKPSKANEAAFERAVEDIAAATRTLLSSLVTAAPPRDRETEAARARERSRQRFGTAAAG